MTWDQWRAMVARMGTFDLHRRLEWSLDFLRWGVERRTYEHRHAVRTALGFRAELRRRGAYRFTGRGCA